MVDNPHPPVDDGDDDLFFGPDDFDLESEVYPADAMIGANGSTSPETPSDDSAPLPVVVSSDVVEQAARARRLLDALDAASAGGDSDEDDSTSGVIFNFRPYNTPSEHPRFAELERWVRWFVWHFELSEVVPACWAQHDGIAEEIAALHEGWIGIYEAEPGSHHPLDQLTWLGHLESSLTRIGRWDRGNCGQNGKHRPESSRAAWPDQVVAGNPYPDNQERPREFDPDVAATSSTDEEPF
jgi:hypothetical protein